ncbi:Predicted transcriptional regulator [Paenibacillus sp. 1_12]|uniref:BlaI/MecI/CopY family transcriptional regulator n=1 Tax=Paenibacillus sp. 1_12 TaxID=1566278 RepID=UPI0008F21DCF|nr:BlaI/MecI/CopY family transcriptional regulator [Paenibacillus sp. 1_12]SFL22435.1 Predicted transcriptional regulator [Paenibacillus sp. 1_12]
MKITKYMFQEEGLHRFLGTLEARIMEVFWVSKELSIKQMHHQLNEESPCSINTIMTVMNRLYDKGLLHKHTEGRGRTKLTHFKAASTKEQFLAVQTKNVTRGLIEEFGDLMVTHMVDAIDETDPNLIQTLETKLQELKRRNR